MDDSNQRSHVKIVMYPFPFLGWLWSRQLEQIPTPCCDGDVAVVSAVVAMTPGEFHLGDFSVYNACRTMK